MLFQQGLEQHFVIIQWDQRGAGLSYTKHLPVESMNIEQFVSDTIEITHHILQRFKKNQLYLVGHSWGTIIGMLAITRAPELFKRYFGVAQVAHMETSEMLSYKYVLEKSKSVKNKKAYKELLEIGSPPWSNLKYDRIHQKYLEAFGGGITRDGKMVNKIIMALLTSKEYTFFDRLRYFKGLYFSMNSLQVEMRQVNLQKQIDRVEIPIYFLMGKYDLTLPSEPTNDFFNAIKAPEKQWIWFEHSAHTPILEEPEKFVQIILKEIERDSS